jgi:hypothetical protein
LFEPLNANTIAITIININPIIIYNTVLDIELAAFAIFPDNSSGEVYTVLSGSVVLLLDTPPIDALTPVPPVVVPVADDPPDKFNVEPGVKFVDPAEMFVFDPPVTEPLLVEELYGTYLFNSESGCCGGCGKF